MSATVVVGSQWGDEGKGKIVDVFSSEADVVVRSQGGNNAGHTVKNGDETYFLRSIPSGILYENVDCLIGSGALINPKTLLGEMEKLEKSGISLNRLFMDFRAHVVMPWHSELDVAMETLRNNEAIGTTKNGIGPCYSDKAMRIGIRLCDLINAEIFKKKAKLSGQYSNSLLEKVYSKEPVNIASVVEEYIEYGKKLKPFVANISSRIFDALRAGKNVLFEGAQGTLLDLDFGTYPFVTSSNSISAGICTGAGVGPTLIDEVVGVAKAYVTRVGSGPFPTEIFSSLADDIREKGNEFGTNTKRARRIGWIDCVALKNSVLVNGLTSLVLNKLDVLSGVETLKICYAYRNSGGYIVNSFPALLEDFQDLEPVYESFPGFDEKISNCEKYADLPRSCREYIEAIEKYCNCKISMVGVGPRRDQNLKRG